jgi:hypothetical protein
LRYTAGLPTNELFERAIALFDTAYSYGKDSVPIATLARVGKGRALLALGRYADAAAAVTDVANDAKYTLEFSSLTGGEKFWVDEFIGAAQGMNGYRVFSPEGMNGIKWAADYPINQDPRVPLSQISDSLFANPVREKKYVVPSLHLILANGIQARMIEAEAQLQPANAPQGPWLATLNAARATVGLGPLTDPGTAAERVDLLFRERGFWFYLNGQRLGDWRRLVRNYGRLKEKVYTMGPHPGNHFSYPTYGNEFVFSPPTTEQQYNPLYKGCLTKTP